MKNPKTLESHVIVYDDECPLCDIYTDAFIKMKFLNENGRLPYKEVNRIDTSKMDHERSKNEIPLYNSETGNFDYGVTSLLKILGNRWRLFNTIAASKTIVWFIKIIYNFISLNRKVIVPGNNNSNACMPTFSTNYRLAYLGFCWIVVALVLYQFNLLLTDLLPSNGILFEFAIAGGQLLFQGIFLMNKDKETAMSYFGNLMTVSLIGALGLIPLFIINSFVSLHPFVNLAYFLLIAGLMFLDHYRRVCLLNLSKWLCVSWALYRILILTFLI